MKCRTQSALHATPPALPPHCLQNADVYRRRALEAIEQINCLQEFAHARDPSDLSPLFHSEPRLGEAAVRLPACLPAWLGMLASEGECDKLTGMAGSMSSCQSSIAILLPRLTSTRVPCPALPTPALLTPALPTPALPTHPILCRR